mgnify:FL=1|jgi:hypothetical protein
MQEPNEIIPTSPIGSEINVDANLATGFIDMYKHYDHQAVVAQIDALQNEIKDEEGLKESLGDPHQISEDASTFVDNYGHIISSQATRINEITNDLESLILENNVTIAKNEEVVSLLSSEPFQNVKSDIKSINDNMGRAQKFLTRHSRTGRRQPMFTQYQR